jgi:chromosome segregation ATPase
MNETDAIEPTADNVDELESRLDTLRARREKIAEDLERAEGELREAQSAVAAGGGVGTATEAQAERDALQGTLTRIDEEIEAAEERLEKARNRKAEQERLQRLKTTAEEAGNAWGKYIQELEHAREELRAALTEAATALEALREARRQFSSVAGSAREDQITAARAVVEETEGEKIRTGLTHLLSRRAANRVSGVELQGSPLPTDQYADHPVDRPELTETLIQAVKTLAPL